MTDATSLVEDFQWKPQPAAANFVQILIQDACQRCDQLRRLSEQMSSQTGTRLIDWVDHIALHPSAVSADQMLDLGFQTDDADDRHAWRHPGGIFPVLLPDDGAEMQVAIKVDSVSDFMVAQKVAGAEIEGAPHSPLRRGQVAMENGVELWAIERHGRRGFDIEDVRPEQILHALHYLEVFSLRDRDFGSESDIFDYTMELLEAACRDLDVDWVCDLFFQAERRFWQSRNRAAQIQKRRQDALGLGWANHDHHTYRSSREHFTKLIAALEQLGFECRERFYGGREAGWGAQVLEQPACGIVIFADVDLTAEEVSGDFAHEGLEARPELGTVGLWCKLHGEAFLQAGMHHLECQFDFDEARRQLAEGGIETMAPFTDFAYLRQAFTEGETWPVAEARIEAAREGGFISNEHANRFRQAGSIGSHLEILERNEGYKGFNQTGVSEIIRETDPRRQTSI